MDPGNLEKLQQGFHDQCPMKIGYLENCHGKEIEQGRRSPAQFFFEIGVFKQIVYFYRAEAEGLCRIFVLCNCD